MKDEHREAFHRIHKAPLEAFMLRCLCHFLGDETWKERLEDARLYVLKWAKDTKRTIPDRIVNNLAIVVFGWNNFALYASHLRLKPKIPDGFKIEDALGRIVDELLPGGKEVNALDELMQLIAAMVANGRLGYGVHFTDREDGTIILSFDQVFPEAKRYARETDGRELLGEKVYRSMVEEAEKRDGSYVLAVSERGEFEHAESRAVQQRRGVQLDPNALEKELGIDTDTWDPWFGKECGSGKDTGGGDDSSDTWDTK